MIVVGAGDVAMDACRRAKRLPGCEDVKVIYRRGPDEIPARKDELQGAIEEGIELLYNTQPVGVYEAGGQLRAALRRTELRRARRRRTPPSPSTFRTPSTTFACGMVILATGQKTVSEHLDELRADGPARRCTPTGTRCAPPIRRSSPPATAPSAPSTIVMAMHHGHRAAYYVKHFLEGVADPLPYRTPFKTRRVPVAQDALWEVFPREHQDFHGLGDNPVEFPEIESTLRRRVRQARGGALLPLRRRDRLVRLQRAHARGHLRDGAHEARRRPQAARGLHAAAHASRRRHFHPEAATLDDLVFLPANLSRLVIDPYRDACRVETRAGGGRSSSRSPFLVGGLRRRGRGGARRRSRAASRARASPTSAGGRSATACRGSSSPSAGEDEPDPARPRSSRRSATASAPGCPSARPRRPAARPRGRRAPSSRRRSRSRSSTRLDLLVLEGNPPLAGAWPELAGAPDLSVLRDAMRIMRG